MLKAQNDGKKIKGEESLLAHFSPKSRYAEAYRTLRTNISFSMMGDEFKSLVVTSSLPGEGKTTTTINLAHTIAQMGRSVLVVDVDLRKPGMSKRFGVQKVNGFSNIVADVLGKPVNRGRIADFGLRDIIQLNALQLRTCVLNIVNKQNEVEFVFLKGELVDIYWKNRPGAKKLASVLIRERLLTESEAKIAFVHQKKSARRLGAVLLNLKMVEERELNKILAIQVMESFGVAVAMDDGRFSVKPNVEDGMYYPDLQSMNLSQLTNEFFASDGIKTSYLEKNIEDKILPMAEENLFLLPSGIVPPNPSELIGSVKSTYLLNVLKKKFDVVLVDSSPIVSASDALLLSQLVDGVVLVIESGATNRTLVKDVVQQLKMAKANIIGVVLNRADISKGSYYTY